MNPAIRGITGLECISCLVAELWAQFFVFSNFSKGVLIDHHLIIILTRHIMTFVGVASHDARGALRVEHSRHAGRNKTDLLHKARDFV